MHYRVGLSEFSRSDYAGLPAGQPHLRERAVDADRPDDLVWVHDYHLIPLAAELRALGVTNPIGYFHHIPWPAPEVSARCPGSRTSCAPSPITTSSASRPSATPTTCAAASSRRPAPRPTGRTRLVAGPRAHPGQELPDRHRRPPASSRPPSAPGSNRLVRQTVAGLGLARLIIGVDRLDYSKGIPERMEAFERFLVSNPDQRGRVTYLQVAPKSRSEVPEYAMLSRTVNETLGRMNGSLGARG